MVSTSMKSQLKREIEDLEKRFSGPVPANMKSGTLYGNINYYTDIESLIKQKKKEMYGGSKKKPSVKPKKPVKPKKTKKSVKSKK